MTSGAAARSKRGSALLAIGLWGAALAAALPLLPRLGSVAATDPLEFFPADAPSRASMAALGRLFPDARSASQIAVVLETEAPGARIADARPAVAALAAQLRADLPAGSVSAVLAPTDDPVAADRLESRDGRAALLLLRLPLGFASEGASEVVARVEAVVAEARLGEAPLPLRATLSGDATLGRDYLAAIEEGARRSVVATVALVAGILLLAYRSPVAVAISLVTLGAALGVATGALTLAAQAGLPVAYASRGFLAALVYGVGTDYCLLLFARVREETARGGEGDALSRARRRAAPVLVTSAAAVAVACALMGLARFGLFRDSGPALALGVASVLAAVLTLAPALMRLAGRALFWPARPRREVRGRLWPAIARLALGRPVLVLALGLAPLVPLAVLARGLVPAFELELDIPERSPSQAGFEALTRHFAPAEVSPLALVVETLPGAPGLRSADGLDGLYQLTRRLADLPGVARVWSASRPTGEGEPLAEATLGRQLERIRAGLARAGAGAEELARGLVGGRAEVARGRAELEVRRQEVGAERERSLLGAFAPGRFEAAQRDLAALEARLAALEAGLRAGTLGAEALRAGLEQALARLRALAAASGSARLLDRVALTEADIAGLPELARALDHYVARDGGAARFELELAAPPSSPEARALVERLRIELPTVLDALGLGPARVWQHGASPISADLAALTRADRARLDLWIVAGVFVLLVALLRGLAAPAAITVYVLASYLAALGALRALAAAGLWSGVDWKAPFFLFVLLVAIGADYGIFVLGRAREEARALPFDAALARAVEATGPVVTSCGLVLAGTFATLVVSRVAFLEQVGIGITVGVLIDTLVVRPFLLPATAVLLHRLGAR